MNQSLALTNDVVKQKKSKHETFNSILFFLTLFYFLVKNQILKQKFQKHIYKKFQDKNSKI